MKNCLILAVLICIPVALFSGCWKEDSLPDSTVSQSHAGKAKVFDPVYPEKVPKIIVFERDLKPLLEIKCVQCHNHIDAKHNAGLNLETRKTAMTTGKNAPVILPGNPKDSLLIKVLELDINHPTNMPPSPDKIWGTRMKILKKWIRQGAIWPDDVRMIRPQDQPE